MPYVRQPLVFVAALAAVIISGCGGSSGGGTPPNPSAVAPVILVAGSQRTFSGTSTTTHTFTNPGTGQNNDTSSSTYTAVTTISAAAPGAPAAFDVNQAVNFSVTQPATTGTQNLSTNTDTFENQTMSGGSTTISQMASKEVIVANDVSAANAGGGPYTLTTNESTTDATPITTVFPLQTGLSTTEPLARTITETQTDLSAGGAPPPASFLYVTAQTQIFNNDGSFSVNPRSYSNGEIRNLTENSNGTGSQADTNTPFSQTVGLPVLAGATYQIPVNTTSMSGASSADEAADWYPGGSFPSSPLELDNVTIKGAVGALPSACAGALVLPNTVEVDTNETTLDVFGSYTIEAQQAFNANGVNSCLLRTTTTTSYSLKNGALTETTTNSVVQILTAVNTAAARKKR